MTHPPTLAELIQPCGPVIDRRAAERAWAALEPTARREGWADVLDAAWPALAPAFAAAPYLARLARARPTRLGGLLRSPSDNALRLLLARTSAAPDEADPAETLRRCKAEVHLLTALADLGGAWTLEHVTGALSDFADVAVQAAIRVAATEERRRGRLLPGDEAVPGFVLLALGKHGAGELNYSSDIDVTAFHEPSALPLAAGVEPNAWASRFVQAVAAVLQDRTAEGYVFRVDLRLRPDPSSTPPATPVDAALEYYESVGQNWERAAFIKARVCAGDRARGEAFLKALRPFVWRRSLDFAAIEDVKSIKRQIHAARGGEATAAAGADLKLGRGGIREIEFFVQTQQLILGGRDPTLRSPRTLDALSALAAAGHVSGPAARDLQAAYVRLRGLEHRVQMLHDEQTHRLPRDPAERRRVAALAGAKGLATFDRSVSAMLKRVNRRYAALFSDAEPLSAPQGSLVFTGVGDDPETLRTLAHIGFAEPATVSATIRHWHHGRIAATRSERGRELFTRLAPRLLQAAAATGAPDLAMRRFSAFFAGLSGGVQVQAMLLARPELLRLLLEVLSFAPGPAAVLSRKPAILDALLDADFFAPMRERPPAMAVQGTSGFEAAMEAARAAHAEQAFRVDVHVLTGRASAEDAGAALAALADSCITALAPVALAEIVRLAGELTDGRAAVVALGRAGAREMTAASDLDLMVVYDAPEGAASGGRGWEAETFYGRFCQRLITALSAQTAQGGLYDVDMRLRPSGGKGPVAAPLSGLRDYYVRQAETWELMALTRARVVWAAPPAFGGVVQRALDEALRRPCDPAMVSSDIAEMRVLVAAEKPARGVWDLKRSDGGLIDIEFAAQRLHLAVAGAVSVAPGTLAAIEAGRRAKLVSDHDAKALAEAWMLQQALAQVLAVAGLHGGDPSGESAAFKRLLARAGGAKSYAALLSRLSRARERAHAAWLSAVGDGSPGVVRSRGEDGSTQDVST